MPKRTFFHLPVEKQKRLLEAAKVEFAQKGLNEASIANIVKLAEIPRGSFYQYFENKEDLYYYYFDLLRQDSKKNLMKNIEEANGDVFQGFDAYFSRQIHEMLTGQHASFYKNLFNSMDYRSTKRVSPKFASTEGHPHQKTGQSFYEQVDLTHLCVENEQEFKLFMQIIMGCVFASINEGYRALENDPEYDVSETIDHFKLKLRWIKEGVYK